MGGKNVKDILAERVGFEPTVANGDTRSPGAPDRPLQHLSIICVAERVGFEPTRLIAHRFSRAAP
jgi:hypothetical protein